MDDQIDYYPFTPNHALPILFTCLIGLSLALHIYQATHYHFWRVMFFMIWGGLVFTSGWIMRAVSSYHPTNRNLYIAQSCLILGGPPIYAAAEYNVLGRLMHYLPQHAPLNPNRLVYVFIYAGAAVESLTAAGAAMSATASGKDERKVKNGMTLIAIAVVLQAIIELVFCGTVGLVHWRAFKTSMVTQNVRSICIMLYGTSTLVLARNIFRAVESFSLMNEVASNDCGSKCHSVLVYEWYIYVFEAAPMLLYTWWLNIMHPGKYLPRRKNIFLDNDREVRIGPGWTDNRPTWETFMDPFDFRGLAGGDPAHEQYWLDSGRWPTESEGYHAGLLASPPQPKPQMLEH